MPELTVRTDGEPSLDERVEEWLDGALVPLDRARATVLRVSIAITPTRWLVSRKERRFLATACVGLLVTCLLALRFPAFLFATTPLLFGIPHVLGDVRYLVLRRALSRLEKLLLLLPAPAFVAFRVAEYGFGMDVSRTEIACLAAWISLGLALAAARARIGARPFWPLLRCAILAVLLAAGTRAALREPYLFRIGFAHAHNLVGPILFLAFFRSSWRVGLIPLALLALLSFAIFSFATLPVQGMDSAFGAPLVATASWMAPGLSAEIGVKLVVLFVFLQGVHYAVLLSWMPQLDTRAEGTLSFRMTSRMLFKDLGWVVLVLSVTSMVSLLAFATTDVHRARMLYLGTATFHGYLELVMFAYFLVIRGVRAVPQDRI